MLGCPFDTDDLTSRVAGQGCRTSTCPRHRDPCRNHEKRCRFRSLFPRLSDLIVRRADLSRVTAIFRCAGLRRGSGLHGHYHRHRCQSTHGREHHSTDPPCSSGDRRDRPPALSKTPTDCLVATVRRGSPQALTRSGRVPVGRRAVWLLHLLSPFEDRGPRFPHPCPHQDALSNGPSFRFAPSRSRLFRSPH